MANAAKLASKVDKEEMKAQQSSKAAEAAGKRSKKKQDKGEMKMYLMGAAFVGLLCFGVYLAATETSGSSKRGASPEDRLVNEDRFIQDVQASSAGNFTTAASTFFKGWKVEDVKYGLGGISTSPMIGMAGAAQFCEGEDSFESGAIPTAFDSREMWEECIPEIRDSGNCSSSYAIAAAAALSARFCVADSTKYARLNLSPQQVLSCDTGSKGCKGGGVDAVWGYMERRGLYPEECLAYKGTGAKETKCKTECDDSKKHKLINYCVMGKAKAIKREIQSRGPVVQPIMLMDDFLVYSGGVYMPTELARPIYGKDGKQVMGAVTVVGWGISQGIQYWTVAQSWGASWGEQGYARVAMNSDVLRATALVGYPATAEALVLAEKEKAEEAVRKEERKAERAARDARIAEQQSVRRAEEEAKRAAGGEDADLDADFDADFEDGAFDDLVDDGEEIDLGDGEM